MNTSSNSGMSSGGIGGSGGGVLGGFITLTIDMAVLSILKRKMKLQ